MKKIIMIIIIVSMHVFNITKVCADEGLKIEQGALRNNKNDAYVSITDIYGIPLFTEKTIKQNEENETQEKNNLEDINNNMFLDIKTIDSSKKEEFIKLVENHNLFVKPKEETKIRYIQEKDSVQFVIVLIGIILLCVLTTILTRKYYKYKSQKDDDSSEYKDYVRS